MRWTCLQWWARSFKCGFLNVLNLWLIVDADLVGVPDEECYDYGVQLRTLAQARGFSSIQFTRLSNLMDLGDGEKISKGDYLRLVPVIRKKLMSSKYLDPKFDMERELQSNPDTKLTYQSYFSRISEDLKWAKGFDTAVASNPALYDAEVSRVTIEMMRRLIVSLFFICRSVPEQFLLFSTTARPLIKRTLQAYEALINSTSLSQLIRLSIHPSLGKSKISIPLLPHGDRFGDMPWHGSVAMMLNGQITTGNARDFRSRYETIFKGGKPYAFRQPSPLYDWSVDVEFQHGYEELLVKNPRNEVQFLEREDRLKLARLIVLLNDKTVRVEGFAVPGSLLTEV